MTNLIYLSLLAVKQALSDMEIINFVEIIVGIIIGILFFFLIINFLYNVPKELKRIADALEGKSGKVAKKQGDISKQDDISMYVDKP